MSEAAASPQELIEEYFDGGAVIGEDEDVHLEVGQASLVVTIQQAEDVLLALASVIRRLRKKSGGGE